MTTLKKDMSPISQRMKKIFGSISLCIAFLFIGIFVDRILLVKKISLPIKSDKVEEIRLSGYKFINPLLECEYSKDEYQINGLDQLHDQVVKFIDKEKSAGNVSDAAVYFRDLNNGPWFGINEHMNFSPASLLKLPVMMAYFKKAEDDPSILKKEIEFKRGQVVPVQEFSKPSLVEGKRYTIAQLIEKMIAKSDNDALFLLEDAIDNSFIDKVTLDLGVETANDTTPENYMSVKGYAGLFRILFNASYLSQSYSENALDILSHSQFEKGITSDLPKELVVAHKYGERDLPEGVQLHDCGVVYYPNHPYLLCIMTRGKDYSKLAKTVSTISKIVYDDLDRKYKNSHQ